MKKTIASKDPEELLNDYGCKLEWGCGRINELPIRLSSGGILDVGESKETFDRWANSIDHTFDLWLPKEQRRFMRWMEELRENKIGNCKTK